jgi:hypothetical protein
MFNSIHQLRGLLLITLLCFITACGSDSSSGGPPPSVYVTNVELKATDTSFADGDSQLIEGEATFSDVETRSASSTSSTWSSDNESIATVDIYGVVTGKSEGITTINAVYNGAQNEEGEFVTGTIEITITAAEVREIEIYSEENTVPLGKNIQYQAFATYSNENYDELDHIDIVWTSSDPTVATIDAAGLTDTLTAGETTISLNYQGIQSSTLLTVTSATLESLTISPEVEGETSVPAGYTFKFTAEGTYSDDTKGPITNDVTWLSLDHRVLDEVEPKGTFRGVGPGSTEIKATLGSVSNQISVIVTPEVLLSVDIEADQDSFPIGLRTRLTARGYFSNDINKDITGQDNVSWESDNPDFARVNANGLLTAVDIGEVNISLTVTNSAGDVFSDTQLFSITDAELSRIPIEVSPKAAYLVPGESLHYIAKGLYTNHTVHLLNNQENIVWSVSENTGGPISSSIVSIDPKKGKINNQMDNGLAITQQISVEVVVDGHLGVTFANLGAVRVLSSDNLSFTGTFIQGDVIQLDLTITSEEVNIEDGMSGPENQSFIMLTYDEADSVCQELIYNKHTNYRLPTATELTKLWNDKTADPAVDYEFYTKYNWSVGKNYWTSTTDDSGATYKVIDLGKGGEQISTNMEYNYVSCVRSPVSP